MPDGFVCGQKFSLQVTQPHSTLFRFYRLFISSKINSLQNASDILLLE
jgi:hypothetical protein